MIYDILSVYYDALVRDEEATKAWVDFVKKHCKG
ncbi:MAG: class I SAM-dependent methyltransferase, partial [Erysipelotrichaceae bacterium]|nr:class I SAM-dependent methyltransferase [Erysipelotrichaceae bacterium]